MRIILGPSRCRVPVNSPFDPRDGTARTRDPNKNGSGILIVLVRRLVVDLRDRVKRKNAI